MNTTTLKNRVLSVVLAVVMVLSMTPLSVFAESRADYSVDEDTAVKKTVTGSAGYAVDEDAAAQKARSRAALLTNADAPAIQLGVAGLQGPSDQTGTDGTYAPNSYLYFGHYNDCCKWRVLSTTASTGEAGVFLLSEELLDRNTMFNSISSDNAWDSSTVKVWCNWFADDFFTDAERGAILSTTKTESGGWVFGGRTTGGLRFQDCTMTDASVFFLSAQEAQAFLGSYRNTPDSTAEAWWLRSPYAADEPGGIPYAGVLRTDGTVGVQAVNTSASARPALNLNGSKVLFMSPAIGGKTEDGLTAVGTCTDGQWKLTLADDAHSAFQAAVTAVNGSTLTVSYTGAVSGDDITALITDDAGNVTHYGAVAQAAAAAGTVTITLPDGFDAETDTLYVLNEHRSGDCMTDYASPLTALSLTVAPQEPVAEVTMETSGGITWRKEYTDLLAAFDAAGLGQFTDENGAVQNAETVSVDLLQANKTYTLESDKNFPISFEESCRVIVDLNGCTLARTITDLSGGIVRCAGAANVTFYNGTLDFTISAYTAIAIQMEDSPTLTLEDMNVKVTGTQSGSFTCTGYAICVDGGALYIKGDGAYGTVNVNGDTVKLSGGSYEQLLADSYAECLETGYIYTTKDGDYIDPSTLRWTDDSAVDLHVTFCTHAGGLINSTCARCGFTCKHTAPNSDSKCSTCGQTLVAYGYYDNDSYQNPDWYAGLTEAFDRIADNGTIRVVQTLPAGSCVFGKNKTVILDVSGQSLTNNDADAALVVLDGRLTIEAPVNPDFPPTIINTGSGYAVEVPYSGTLEFKGSAVIQGGLWVNGTLAGGLKAGTILLAGSNGSVSLGGHSNYEHVYELLADGCAFAAYDADTGTTGDILPADVTVLTGDVIVVRCTHANADGSLFEDGQCTGCGYRCRHAAVENNTCTLCKAEMWAKDNTGRYYLDLSEAFEGVASGGTVTMLATPPDDYDLIGFCFNAEGDLVDKTVTLVMDGHNLSYDGGTFGNPFLAIYSGTLIVRDEAVISLTNCSDYPAVDVAGGTLELQSKATITGGLMVSYNWGGPDTTYGTLAGGLKEGTVLRKGSNSYSLAIDSNPNYEYVRDLLPDSDHYAFAVYVAGEDTHPTIVNGKVKELTEDVIVVAHTHDPQKTVSGSDSVTFVCACGFECPHDSFTNGICDTCRKACTHDQATHDEDGAPICRFCRKPFAVQVINLDGTSSYYMESTDAHGSENTLSQVFADAKDYSTVTLLTDGLLANANISVPAGETKTIWLDMNGKTLAGDSSPTAGITIHPGVTLTVIGNGGSAAPSDDENLKAFLIAGGTLDLASWPRSEASAFHGVYVDAGGTLISANDPNAAIGVLTIAGSDAKVALKQGTYRKIVCRYDTKASGLLAKNSEGGSGGYAFRNADGSYVPYDTAIAANGSLENVTVVVCPHDSVHDRSCDSCGMAGIVAMVMYRDGSIYGTYAEAYTQEEINAKAQYALEYHLSWSDYTMKLYADFTLTDVTWNSGSSGNSFPLDLNGHAVTGGTLTIQSGNTYIVTDSSQDKNGAFANVVVESGAALKVDGVKVSGVTLKSGSRLDSTDGSFGSIQADSGSLVDFLPRGYAFAGLDGNVVSGHVAALTNVRIVPHTRHVGVNWDTTSHKLFCACGQMTAQDTISPKFEGLKYGQTYYGDVKFRVTHQYDFTVTDNGETITPDEEGYYTIKADNATHTIRATAVSGNNNFELVTVNKVYSVTLVSGTGYTVAADKLTVGHGQDYTFKVTIEPGYSRVTGRYKVLVNGVEVPSGLGDETYDQFTVTAEGDLTITVEGVADITAPDVEMTIGNNSFKQLLNDISFGLFFKNTQTVNVTASDLGSGVNDSTAAYLVIDGVFNAATMPTEGWTSFTMRNGEGIFSIEPNAVGSVYVRVADKDGNIAVINSKGMVVYTDSEASANDISITRLMEGNIIISVEPHGNTVKSIRCDNVEISSELYTVRYPKPTSSSTTVTIELENAFLRTLAAGTYTITVSYDPMGITYTPAEGSGSEAPTETTVTLTVTRDTRTLDFSAPNADYDGQAYDDLTITGKPNGTTVEYKAQGAEDSTYTTAAPKDAGSYTVRITTPQDDNYNERTFTTSFEISPKTVTINGVTADSKTYDASTAATISGTATLSDNYDGGSLTIDTSNAKAAFDSKNVGTDKTVTFSGFALGGAAAKNYELTAQPASVTANIVPKNLTVENLKVKDKVYDGTDKAEIDGTPALKGVEEGDEVQLNCGTPTFSTTDVGENIAVNFTEFTLTGADSGNYTLTQPTDITASINEWLVDGSEYTVNSNDWINTDFVITAKSGYQLSLTNTASGNWATRLTADDETDSGALTFYVQNTATGAISNAVTVRYKIDKTAPTGTITLNGSETFDTLPSIGFDTFYNHDVTVEITGADTASDVKSVSYYKANKALTSGDIQTITGWTEGRDFTIEAVDMARFVVYARIEDNAGNVTYLSTGGAEFDTTEPEIVGVDDGETYYVTQRVFVDDENLASVTLNGAAQAVGVSFDLAGDTNAAYTIVATDKAGNVTTYTVTMKPISSITDAIKDITEENVKSSDAASVNGVSQQILDVAAAADEDVIGQEQWGKLLAASANCKKLETRIAAVAAEIARLTDAVNGYDIDKVTSADKADIEQLIAGIDALLATDNLTNAERAALEALRLTAQGLLSRIAEAGNAAAADEITEVKDVTRDNVTTGDKDDLKKAEKALEDALKDYDGNYTGEERKALEDALDNVKASLDAIENAEKVAEEVRKLPSVDKVTTSDRSEVERVQKLIDALTGNEKSMLGKDAMDKVKALAKRIDALSIHIDRTSESPRSGDAGLLAYGVTALGSYTGAALLLRRRKREDR